MIVDLTVPLNEQTPVYPGDPAIKIKPSGNLSTDGYCGHDISVGTHVGTHIDAPMHMLENGASLDDIDINSFVGRGVYIDVKKHGFDAVKSADIKPRDIVLFHTGMSDSYQDAIYFENYPVMSEDVAQYLIDKGVSMVGIDACSVDGQAEFPIHKILLGGQCLIIENLTNLGQLADTSFKVYALPIRLQIDGAPARVIAEIQS